MNDFLEEIHPGSLESHTLYCRIKFLEFLSAIEEGSSLVIQLEPATVDLPKNGKRSFCLWPGSQYISTLLETVWSVLKTSISNILAS